MSTETKEKKKINILYIVFIAALFAGLVFQFVFPQPMAKQMTAYLKDCTSIVIQEYEGDKTILHTADSPEEIFQFTDWASSVKTRSKSLGDEIFSHEELPEMCDIVFYRAGGIVSVVTIYENGKVSDSAKRYKLLNYDQTLLDSLYESVASWEVSTK